MLKNNSKYNTTIKYLIFICLNLSKNLILVLIERFSVVLRHANRYYPKNILFINSLYFNKNIKKKYKIEIKEIRCRGEDSK